MVLTPEQCQQVREELEHCKRPMYLFDDDPDGLSSFLLLYRYKQEGKGIPVKSNPFVDDKFLRIVEEYGPDKIFVVDIPKIEQSFLDQVKVPVIWIDHHGPYKRNKVKYFNPRVKNQEDGSSTAANCYAIVEQDLWIAMVGAVGDWQLPYFTEQFRKAYPDLLPKNIEKPEQALFASKVGELVRIFAAALKGRAGETMKYVKALSRIQSPHELLEGKTPNAKFIRKKYLEIKEQYDKILEKAKTSVTEKSFIVFTYPDQQMSFTKELSNELLFHHPKKIVIVGRIKEEKVKISLRSASVQLNTLLPKALEGIDGYGGGHEYACGAVVPEAQFEQFVQQLQDLVTKR